jgi:cytochrome c556
MSFPTMPPKGRQFNQPRAWQGHEAAVSSAAIFIATRIVDMRAALLILLGLVIGILGTVPVMNTLSERNPMPKAVMTTMGYHMHQLKGALKSQRCEAAVSLDQLQHMQVIASDIPAAFPGAPQPFVDDANHLRSALKAAVLAAPADCPALATALEPVGKACQTCHNQYR